jgi:hypothetical protein
MKAFFKKIAAAFVAAVTSPDAVAAEKSLAVLIITRFLLAVGASASLVAVLEKLFSYAARPGGVGSSP